MTSQVLRNALVYTGIRLMVGLAVLYFLAQFPFTAIAVVYQRY